MNNFSNYIVISEELGKIKVTKLTHISASLPQELESLKIIYLADLHHGVYTHNHLAKEVVEITNSRSPDLILLGGDYVHMGKKHFREKLYKISGNALSNYYQYRRTTRFAAKELSIQLSNLKSTLGVYGVVGNHDYYEGIRTVKRYLNSINWLINSNTKINIGNSELILYGIDDYREGKPNFIDTFGTTENYHSFMTNKKTNEFRIFLGHNPDSLLLPDSEYVRGTDIALFGHTHGGQVCLPGSIPIKTETKQRNFFKGFSRYRETPVYVSSGLGNSGLPFRLFCPPEIVEITLKKGT